MFSNLYPCPFIRRENKSITYQGVMVRIELIDESIDETNGIHMASEKSIIFTFQLN